MQSEYPFNHESAADDHEKFQNVLRLRHDYDDATGTALIGTLLVEKNIHIRRALVYAIFPIWLPKADTTFVRMGVWPLEPELTLSVLRHCRRHRVHSFDSTATQWNQSEDIYKKVASIYYSVFHDEHGPETAFLVRSLLEQLKTHEPCSVTNHTEIMKDLLLAADALEKGEPF